ncbi:MAG: hypothetical protein CME70_18060 [Halobacteriovorax sp.]|nr:hypothetical protein [Halobacteriovorax sp.]|tara:strand:+ start:801 stop:1016 length:216 start_codon:yes stop_codon:yes gene_type:complete
MTTKNAKKAWQELSDRCGRIKAEDQHHNIIMANRFMAIHDAANELVAMGNYCPEEIAYDCSYTDLERYIKE